MKTLKSKLIEIYKEIVDDNQKDLLDRKYRCQYRLTNVLLDYYDKETNKLIMEKYNDKNVMIYLNEVPYVLKVINDVMFIYNDQSRAVSITYSDGYEWVGNSLINQQAVLAENKFWLNYNKFMNDYNISTNNVSKLYNRVLNLVNSLNNNIFLRDVSEARNVLDKIKNELTYYNEENNKIYNDHLNTIKKINSEISHYSAKQTEIDQALVNLEKYYKWIKKVERLNMNNLSYNDPFLILVRDFELQYNKMLKSISNTQKDWNLIEYYHEELTKTIYNRKELKCKEDIDETKVEDHVNDNKDQKISEVEVQMVDLSDVPDKDGIKLVDINKDKKIRKHKFFKKLTKIEKADYLTWKAFNEFNLEDKQFDANKITVKEAKKYVKNFDKKQNAYEKLVDNDVKEELGNINYTVYNSIKEAKNDLLETQVMDEENTNEVFMDLLSDKYDRDVYEERQKYLKDSAKKVKRFSNILANIPESSLEKIRNNYLKVRKRALALRTGILAGILAVTSFGVGNIKLNNNNKLIYSDDNIDIYGSDNQEVTLSTEEMIVESILESENQKIGNSETLPQLNESEILTEVVESETLTETIPESETLIEANETLPEVVESETLTEVNEVPVEESNNEIAFDETLNDESECSLSYAVDERGLLETYKNELEYLKSSLPKSEIVFDDIRSIGSEINITDDARLQNDEYSLILDSEGHSSLHKDDLPRVICSVVMSDGVSGKTAKTMEEVNDLVNQGYYVAGYGVLNPYSENINNIEGFFDSEDVYGLVRK